MFWFQKIGGEMCTDINVSCCLTGWWKQLQGGNSGFIFKHVNKCVCMLSTLQITCTLILLLHFKGGQCLLTIQGWVQVALCHWHCNCRLRLKYSLLCLIITQGDQIKSPQRSRSLLPSSGCVLVCKSQVFRVSELFLVAISSACLKKSFSNDPM